MLQSGAAGTEHAVARGAYQVGVRRTQRQQIVEEDLPFDMVLGWAWKTGGDTEGIQRQWRTGRRDRPQESDSHGSALE